MLKPGDPLLSIATDAHKLADGSDANLLAANEAVVRFLPKQLDRLRQALEAQFGPEYADWLDELSRRRQEILRTVADPAKRRLLLEELAASSPLSRRKRE